MRCKNCSMITDECVCPGNKSKPQYKVVEGLIFVTPTGVRITPPYLVEIGDDDYEKLTGKYSARQTTNKNGKTQSTPL